MAVVAGEGKIGADVMMFAKIGTPAAWVPLGCGKSSGWSGTTDMIDTTSQCSGRDKTAIAGYKSSTFSFEGIAVNEEAVPTKASFKTLSGLWNSGAKFPLKLVGVDDPTDIIRGDVLIASLDKSGSFNETVGFSASFNVTGPVSFTPEA